jgi:tRNA(Ile)-lysidine synthase
MSLQQLFIQHWQQQFKPYIPTNAHFFIAVSGGVDSIVLTHLFYLCGVDFTILHANFQLRGEESLRDEMFVASLEKKYNKKVFIKKFDTATYAATKKISIQVAARELRYLWFNEVLENTNIDVAKKYLVTAHHADDNIETVLMNICRGTGIKGLTGIPAHQQKIIRPLLFARRQQIIAFAQEQNLQWVNDSSNNTEKYTRNFFRHQLIPLMKKAYSQADENIIHNIEKWKEVELIYNIYIQQQKEKLFAYKGAEIHIPILKLKKQPALHTLVNEIIIDYGFTASQIKDVIQLFNADNGKYVSSVTHRIIKNRQWLMIAPINTLQATQIIIDEHDKEVYFDDKKITISYSANIKISDNPLTACIDFKHLTFPLILRKWKTGDYFYPLGMSKKKKIARFLIDIKCSTTEKEKVWVVESNKKIIWVVGFRIDNRFKLTENTTKKIQLTVH